MQDHKLICRGCKEESNRLIVNSDKQLGPFCPHCMNEYRVRGNKAFTAVDTIDIKGEPMSVKYAGEMDRRVSVKQPDGTWKLFRKGENGKLQDKHPTYGDFE